MNIPGQQKERAMGGSMVQGLEKQPGDLGSGFGPPQTLCMNKEDKMDTRRLLCPRDIQAWCLQSTRTHTAGRWEVKFGIPEHHHPICVSLAQC